MDTAVMDDSTMPDATMMDGTIDDLFGEAADGLGVSLPSPPLPAHLTIRIAEMKGNGCCTKLAWSQTGSIASISADGSNISFRAMVRDRKTGMWVLGEESKNPIPAPETRSWLHVQFNGVGTDLAAIDNRGVVHLYTLTGPLSKMHAAAGNLTQDDRNGNELDEVVGMCWLPLFPMEFRAPYIDSANKIGERWEASQKLRDPNDPKCHNPADNKHAMFYVSRSAKLTLMYQNEGQGWQSTSLDFNSIASSEDLISHAGLGSDGADMLLMTYDFAARFRLYRISINWNATSHTRAPNTTFTLVQPSLSAARLGGFETRQSKHAGAELTHLRIIPAVAASLANGMTNFPTILAVFTKAVPADASKSFSIISRWHAEPFTNIIHDSFVKLKLGTAASNTARPTTELRRQPDIITDKIIMCIESQNYDTLLAFGASDGSLDLRERLTMTSLEPNYEDTLTVGSLPQSGFEHIPSVHHVNVAMSADASGLVMMRADGKLTAQLMSFRYGWQEMDGIADNRALIEAAVVCLARQFAQLLYHQTTSDETLALMPSDVNKEHKSMIIKMIFRLLSRSPDISMQEIQKQQMLVLRDPLVPRILSAQLALGTDGYTGQRNFAGQFAFAMLNMRLIGTALATTLGMGRMNAISAEATHSLRGLVKWMIDFTIYIINTLINVDESSKGTSVKDAFEREISNSGNPSLHILLCSYSRAMLRFQMNWVRKYFQTIPAVIPRAKSVTERHELNELAELASKLPFKLNQFDQMLAELDTSVRDTYTNNAISADRRSDIEMAMMADGIIPAELTNSVITLIESLLPKVREGADMSRLYFWQTEWLGLTSNIPQSHKIHYDAIRKVPIPTGSLLRRCRRCGSEMEDIPLEKLRTLPGWLSSAQKHCICMNFWHLP